ncbi:MAG: hydroxymethylglutaryl-CoA reductase [Oligoflexia bacterium]|nr:hydroxymethylglutaryl-CoA reductase [Oligoflexia bacterium]
MKRSGADSCSGVREEMLSWMKSFWHVNAPTQEIFRNFSENNLSNFFLPYGVVPNFLLNDRMYIVPVVTEESSVVAALSKSAKFWAEHGGFHARVLGTEKLGQIHFYSRIPASEMQKVFDAALPALKEAAVPLLSRMKQRGGGITKIDLLDKTTEEPGYYQIRVGFTTADAMGANLINSVLEEMAQALKEFVGCETGSNVDIIMAILSNYTPNCLVESWVSCPALSLTKHTHLGERFVERFLKAVRIAEIDVGRAVTHNKGIYNGIDAVILATGNDFRAVEAQGHAYASSSPESPAGYRSLSKASVDEQGIFHFCLKIPLTLGTVGGITAVHPLAKFSLQLLGNPSAAELMQVVASVGLAQNFAAIQSLITTGIQQGHMRMHIYNMAKQLGASPEEILALRRAIGTDTVTHSRVQYILEEIRARRGKDP